MVDWGEVGWIWVICGEAGGWDISRGWGRGLIGGTRLGWVGLGWVSKRVEATTLPSLLLDDFAWILVGFGMGIARG